MLMIGNFPNRWAKITSIPKLVMHSLAQSQTCGLKNSSRKILPRLDWLSRKELSSSPVMMVPPLPCKLVMSLPPKPARRSSHPYPVLPQACPHKKKPSFKKCASLKFLITIKSLKSMAMASRIFLYRLIKFVTPCLHESMLQMQSNVKSSREVHR